MKLKLTLLLLLITHLAFCQQEASNWYFGKNAGIKFHPNGTVTALTDGQLNTLEGCATLSDTSGQLLFYTDGRTIYNKNHQVMLNGAGLNGHTSSSQSATIVGKPGSPNLFYVFTIDASGHPLGFCYSIVDMSLNNGLGAVTADKNVMVYAPTCEKISIVKHANNTDYWIITHGWNNNTFYSHQLTSGGLGSVPVISVSGAVVSSSDGDNAIGYMKISPDGSKLAVCHAFVYKAELFDFNNASGIVSNPQTILNDNTQIYGAEFSPNSEVLYVSISASHKLYQFDLTASNIASSAILFNHVLGYLGALQLGPDGKIYLAQLDKTKLTVINNPNILGSGCDIQVDAVDLAGKQSQAGLPAFVTSFFYQPAIQFENTCAGENVQLELNTNQTILSATWDFGDGSPTSNAITANHTYTTPGMYTVTVTATSTLGMGTNTREIVISAVPTATQPQDILVCDTDNNGLYPFDLTSRSAAILNGQDATLCTVRYFANATDYVNDIAIATPAIYQNAVAYQQQTIIAEVSNNANSDCKSSTTFVIDVFDMPLPNLPVVIPTLTSCDNTTFGTDVDGRVVFNLTQNATAILNGQSSAQFSILYYRDAALTNQILTPAAYTNTNTTETIYVKVVNNDHVNCVGTTSFNLQVFSLPVVTAIVSLKQCDDNVDGFSVFNLTEANSKISTNYLNETFTYFESALAAQNNGTPIPNPTTYTNEIVSNDVVYVKVSNANGCFRVVQLNLNVSTTQIPMNFPQQTFTVCDDAVLGTNTDGVSSFDFSSVTSQIQGIFPVGQQLIITYYRNLADALGENNAITNISNYRNIGYPNSQNIYIRVDSQLNNDCLGLGSHITLNVERIPIVTPQVIRHCDDDQDGQFGFDTTNTQSNLLNGLTNVNVTYYDQNNAALSSPLPNPFVTTSQTLRAVVTNATATGCSYETTIQFVVDDLPEAFAINANLTTVCDDEANPMNQDGEYGFDTGTFQATILNGQTGMTVFYYDQNNIALPSPLPNPFVTATQNIRVEVLNPVNSACKAISTIPFVVKPVPKISLTGEELICSDNLSFTKTIDAGIQDGTPTTDYTYVWKLNGTVIPSQTSYSLTVNQEGIYTVEVFNSQNCSRTRTITVTASDIATIRDVAVNDSSANNSIVVTVSGLGDYVYSLDNVAFQESNVFTNVPSGIYTVYVKDLNGCGIAEKEVSVLGIPNFFTPNGDGYHDYWNITGANAVLNSKTVIHIFDRLGKLIKQISPTSEGWDGTLNNQPLPATDYWYVVALADGRNVKGHFALKR